MDPVKKWHDGSRTIYCTSDAQQRRMAEWAYALGLGVNYPYSGCPWPYRLAVYK